MLHNRRYCEFATQRARLARFSCKLSITPMVRANAIFPHIFSLSLDKNFRSKLCYFLVTDINDLPECLKYSTARKFADDTTITNSYKSTARFHREDNHDLNNLQLLANQLSLNVLKTEYKYFVSNYIYNLSNLGIVALDSLKIEGQPITRAQSTK